MKIVAGPWPAAVAAAAAAFLGRLPALGAWWNQDDWGLLARAAGLTDASGPPLRFLSRDLYWQMLHPLAGLDPDPYAITRLLLHAAAAAGVVRLAGRLGLSALQCWIAGLIMAASPLAFTPLYWAAGVQDLLAVAAMVWALERWLAPGPLARPAALLLALAALASKEVVVGLPLVMIVLTLARPAAPRRPDRVGWIVIAVAAVAAAAAALLALRGFDTAGDRPYALGDAGTLVVNLATYGWWLILPGPSYPASFTGLPALAGLALWLIWAGWGAHAWRRGRRVPLLSLVGALLMLAPLLPLERHLAPDLAYPVEPFGCLALACLVPMRWPARREATLALALAALVWGLLGMRARLHLRDDAGRLADPVVRRTAISWHACRQLRQLPLPEAGLVINQPPLVVETAAVAAELGESWVIGSPLYHSLGGALGPRVLLGPQVPVVWANGLRMTPVEAFVVLDVGDTFRPWGPTRQALLNQVLTDVGLGMFVRARLHLLRASVLAGDTLTLVFDPDVLPVTMAQVLANKEAFIDHLAAGLHDGRSGQEIAGLQENFFRLLSVCTDRDVESLRAPSGPGAAPPGETEKP